MWISFEGDCMSEDKEQQLHINQMIENLGSLNPAIRAIAAEKLGDWSVYEALYPLLPLLSDSDDKVRGEATYAVRRISSNIYETPEEYYGDRHAFMQKATETISETVIPKFIELLSDHNPEVKLGAIRGLYDTARGSAIPQLLTLFDEPDPRVRKAAIQAVGMHRYPKIFPNLLRLLNDPDANVKIAVIKILGRRKSQKAVPYLIELLSDDENKIRQAVILALGDLKAKKAVHYILPLLSDANDDIRCAAIDAMEKLRVTQAIPQITEFAFDDNDYIRSSVVRALPTLIKATKDEDFWVRFSAIEAIGNLGDLALLPVLEDLEQNDLAQVDEGEVTIKDVATQAIENIIARFLS